MLNRIISTHFHDVARRSILRKVALILEPLDNKGHNPLNQAKT